VTDLEDRLRRELLHIAERIDPGSVRPIRAPLRKKVPGMVRWLAPVTAMVAVIGVIVGVTVFVGRQAGQAPGAGTLGTPPYYVTLTGAGVQQPMALTAAVRDSATGAVLTTVDVPLLGSRGLPQGRPSPGQFSSVPSSSVVPSLGNGAPMPSGISAAADGRTFAITDDLGFFLLKVAVGGRSAQLTRLPIHVPYILSDTAALSPDGSQLAIDAELCPGGPCKTGLDVVSLATGAIRTWLAPSMGGPLIPSWTGAAEIMFLWPVPHSTQSGYRLLNVAGPGGSLLGSSRPMVSPPGEDGWAFPGALLTPDGSALITITYQNVPGPHGGSAIVKVVELSARTGQLLGVLHEVTVPRTLDSIFAAESYCSVDALAPAGLSALVQCPGLGRLTGDGQFTPLPGIQAPMNPMTGIGGTAGW
jgi:hypothetical protein